MKKQAWYELVRDVHKLAQGDGELARALRLARIAPGQDVAIVEVLRGLTPRAGERVVMRELLGEARGVEKRLLETIAANYVALNPGEWRDMARRKPKAIVEELVSAVGKHASRMAAGAQDDYGGVDYDDAQVAVERIERGLHPGPYKIEVSVFDDRGVASGTTWSWTGTAGPSSGNLGVMVPRHLSGSTASGRPSDSSGTSPRRSARHPTARPSANCPPRTICGSGMP